MNGTEIRETARNIRAKEFLTERQADFAGIPGAVTLIAQLTASVAKVQTTYQKQISEGENARQDYDEVKEAFRTLRGAVREVAGMALAISKREPGLNELFPIPDGNSRRKLIAEARTAADNAAAHEEKFTGRGLDKSFIQNLRDYADTLENALNAASSSTGKRVGATDTLGKDVDDANDIVQEIDPIVKLVYKNDPANLAAWKFASHIERHTPVPRKPPTS